MSELKAFQGGCHCGAVRFEVLLKPETEVQECTCSMCKKTGFVHIITPKSRFKILQGESELTDYQFNTKTAHHLFCKHCGIKSFYVPRSNPDGFSVNARCLDDYENAPLKWVAAFDGKNWEAQPSIAHLSKE